MAYHIDRFREFEVTDVADTVPQSNGSIIIKVVDIMSIACKGCHSNIRSSSSMMILVALGLPMTVLFIVLVRNASNTSSLSIMRSSVMGMETTCDVTPAAKLTTTGTKAGKSFVTVNDERIP